MTISSATSGFQAAAAAFSGDVEDAKVELATINGQVEALEGQRRAIEGKLPHTDDIIALFSRGLTGISADFERQVQSHLKDTFANAVTYRASAAAVKGKGADILSIGTPPSDRDQIRSANGGRSIDHGISLAAATYFLRDKLAAEIPALVDRLLPSARTGLREADRRAQLAALDAEIIDLKAQASSLHDALVTARAALSGLRG